MHLWLEEVFWKIGDGCGDFMAIDTNTEQRLEFRWARILVIMKNQNCLKTVHLLEGMRSYVLQLWWELPLWFTELRPSTNQVFTARVLREEEVEGCTSAFSRGWFIGSLSKNGSQSSLGDGSIRHGKTCSLEAVAKDFNIVEAEAGVGLREGELGIKELDSRWAIEIGLSPLGHISARLKFTKGVQKEIKKLA